MTGDPQIIRVDRLDCRVKQRPWRFAVERSREIEAHWAQLTAAKPAIYNGQVLLQHSGAVKGGRGERVDRKSVV